MKKILYVIIGIFLVIAVLPVMTHNPEKLRITNKIQLSSGHFIKLNDGLTHYQLKGNRNAPTIVLIHGFTVPYYAWDNNFEQLVNAGFRVLRFDLYGRGYSARPAKKYNVKLYEHQLTQLLQKLKIRQKIHLIGVSMGGAIVEQYAVDYPKRIASVSLIDPAGLPKPIPWQRQLIKLPWLGEYYMRVFGDKLLAPDGSDFYKAERFPTWPVLFQQQTHYIGFKAAILSTIRYFNFYDLQNSIKKLGHMPIPVLLLWGEQDAIIPFHYHKQFQRLIPHIQFHPVKQAGHMANYEQPRIVNQYLIAFLHHHGSKI